MKARNFLLCFLVLLLFCLFASTASAEPTITLVSFSPDPLETNYTGATIISYMVESSDPLNLSSIAFLYGLNYTIPAGGDMHNYISGPPNSIAFEGIYRAPNRNTSPYLSWEFNDTITGGNVWQWGGGDNDSWWVVANPINATHTYINATGITQHVLPSSFYIKKTAMYSAPKTPFEINRAQALIFKMWNVEEIRNRDHNYFANLYFDTMWESTEPTYPIEIGYCNYDYDPATDDIDTSLNCTKFAEWNGTRWVDHSWDPGANASYASPLIINASQFTDPTPTDINYIWLRSNTITSTSFVLNATNHDPGVCNISYSQTETFWTYNELNGVTTPVAYTPSFFSTFVRDDEELLHHLYVADDNGVWGHSEIFNETIGISSVPVPAISFEYFNILCDENYENTHMDATYNGGTIDIGIHAPADPDGGSVTHNITLHYGNGTLVATINNTLTTTGDEYVDVTFNTEPYYSSSEFYTLRCVSEDDEGSIATKWLVSDFTLDADGNQGWIKNEAVNFWGFDDIPELYTVISNDSLMSYNAGDDIYTMHVPFFKSKCNDTFTFSERVHLESLNDENVAYFRFIGCTVFDGAEIYAWNTTTDTPAPITDTYRAYVYSLSRTCGNITDSIFSYLGSDNYRQEGLNFVTNTFPYLIHNSTFSHNAEGPVFEECTNVTISNCTINNNDNVGVGIYFSNNFIIENTTISDNGGRGISVYEGHDNIAQYNDISNNGLHGIHIWSNSENNTALGNDITGNGLYDYYFTSSTTGNYIIDPASSTNLIRATSTSTVNIENTDNSVFSEDSLNTSYAYLSNFSLYATGVSQTFNITQHNAIITPSTDRLAIFNLVWDETPTFNASSDTALNPTWFNITHSYWANDVIEVYRNGTIYTNETANSSGTINFNYSDSYSEKWFEFRTLFRLSGPNPASGVEFDEGTTMIFSISASLLANSSWSLDGEWKENDNDSMNPSYTIPSTLSLGGHTLVINSTSVSNTSNTADYIWTFTKEATHSFIGGGGGGGGGFVPATTVITEPEENVLCFEKGGLRNININSRVTYYIENNDCVLVTSVSFIPTSASREELIHIETLKDRSTFVELDVPNHEIVNFNLYTGKIGYDEFTKDEIISFKVKVDEIEDADLNEEMIKLFRWSNENEIWIQKYTELIDSDQDYYYYKAESGSTTGYFAIASTEQAPGIPLDLSFDGIVSNLPGLGNFDLLMPDFMRTGFLGSIKDFIYGLFKIPIPDLTPQADSELFGMSITSEDVNASEKDENNSNNANSNLTMIAILSMFFIACLSFYYNSKYWNVSMLIGIVVLIAMYLMLGNNMIVIVDSLLMNLLINVLMVSGISLLIPVVYEKINE